MKQWRNLRWAAVGMAFLICLSICACSKNGDDLSFEVHVSIQAGGGYDMSDNTCSVQGIGSFKGSDLEIPSSHISREEARELLRTGIERWMKEKDKQYLRDHMAVISDLYSTERAVTEIAESAFFECTQLESVVIPDTVTRIGTRAFYKCSNLKKVVMSENIEIVDTAAFLGCPEELFTEYEGALYLGNEENPYLLLVGLSSSDVTSVQVHENTKAIAFGAFKKGHALTDLSITNASIVIPYNELDYCESLRNVELPIARGLEYVLNDDGISYSVSGLGSCELGYFSVPSKHEGLPVTGITDHAFSYDADDFADLEKQYKRFAKNCKADGYTDADEIEKMYIQEYGTEYFDLMKLDNIEAVSLHAGIVSIGQNAFHDNVNLYISPENSAYRIENKCRIHLPDQTLLHAVGSHIEVPDGVLAIGEQAVFGPNIKGVTIPSSVTSIDKNAFGDCYNMTSLTILGNVTNIDGIGEEGVFASCSSLNEIYYQGSRKEWASVFPHGIPSLEKTFVYYDYTSSDGRDYYDEDYEIMVYYNFSLEEE